MSCNSGSNGGQNAESGVKKASSCSAGYFGKMFGGAEKKSSDMCAGGCGEESCNCNCLLKNHLKDCCGLGQLPTLVVCPKKDECRQATPPPQTTCTCGAAPPPVACKIESVPVFKPSATCQRQESCGKCPPMPNSNTKACFPNWMCTPPTIKSRSYPAPQGVVILPISIGGRNASQKGTCGGADSGSPNVANKDCPMVRPRCPTLGPKPEEAADNGGGIFSKITSFFGGKK